MTPWLKNLRPMNTPQRSIFIAWTALLIAGLLPHAAWAEDAPPTADELFRAAARSHKQEEWREAAAQWRQFLAAASGDARRETAERFLAMDLAMAGEFDEALEHFGKFVDGYPQSRHLEDVWFNLAGTALRRAQQSHEREHFQMARDAFDRVLELFPASPRRSFAVFHRAQVDLEAGQWEEAGRQFEEFVRDFPYDPLSGDADYFLGYIHFRRGNYQASVDLFQAFLANNAQPTYADQARYVCAEALLAMARFADAEAMFGQAAGSARFKDADAAILNQAMCAARQGHWEEAVRLCRNLPTRFPQSALAPRAALLAAEYLTQDGADSSRVFTGFHVHCTRKPGGCGKDARPYPTPGGPVS
jgi:outer membrane protein assembly factor BamD (BamD/ComL family)